MKERMVKVALFGAIVLVCGLLYGWFCITTGVAIPCVFYKITGYSCPGCGVSRMCINLLKGNLAEAIRCNPALFFCMFPFLIVVTSALLRYIKTGDRTLKKWQNVVLYVIIAVLLVHGVARNIITH